MIELKKVELWKRSVEAISSFISEGNFRFNEKGIQFRAIDPSQVVLVNYEMNKNVFDKYEIEPTFVGVDLGELSKIMSRVLPNDKLVMDLTDSELLIKLEGDLSRSFRLPLIDVSEEDITMPLHKYAAKIEINSRILKEALKDASLFGSSVILRLKGGQFLIEARGSAGSLNISSKESKAISVTGNNKEIVSKYSLNYLMNIVKESDNEKKVVLEMKTDTPIKVSYKIGDSEIQFYLAHMIL